jgi:hypothetical protein
MRDDIIIDPGFEMAGKIDERGTIYQVTNDIHFQYAAHGDHTNKCQCKPGILFPV